MQIFFIGKFQIAAKIKLKWQKQEKSAKHQYHKCLVSKNTVFDGQMTVKTPVTNSPNVKNEPVLIFHMPFHLKKVRNRKTL